jgi:hypothetical protein
MPEPQSYFIDKQRSLRSGFFRYGGISGAATVIAAGTATAGHVYVLRNPADSGKRVHIASLRLAFLPSVAFGAAQLVRLGVYKFSAYSAPHTGGTAITPAKRRTDQTQASVAAARIADTGALTAGTHTIGSVQPLFTIGGWGTVPTFDKTFAPADEYVEVIQPGEGLLVRNEVLMGASGVGVFVVEPEGWER